MSHTPLPWKTGNNDCARKIYSVPHPEYDEIVRCYGQTFEIQMADAEFIVTACNAHEALVELVEGVQAWNRWIDYATLSEGRLERLLKLQGVIAEVLGTLALTKGETE